MSGTSFPTTQSGATSTGRIPITTDLLKERQEYTVALKLAGLSISSIAKQINLKDNIKGWGQVSIRTVERDIAAYYRKNKALTLQDYDHTDQLRAAFLEQTERTIEKLSLHCADKKRQWKPFEYADSLEKLHKMQMNFMEVQNWNLGTKNTQINIQQNNINNVFEAAAVDSHFTKKDIIDGVMEHLEDLLVKIKEAEKIENETDDNIIEVEDVQIT